MLKQRFCHRGHDKDAPHGSYWSWRNYKGRRVPVRQCAWCTRGDRSEYYVPAEEYNVHPNSLANLKLGKNVARSKKEFCIRGHRKTETNSYIHILFGKNDVMKEQRRCKICSRALATVIRRSKGIKPLRRPQVVEKAPPLVIFREPALDKFLALAPRRIHFSDPYERRAM